MKKRGKKWKRKDIILLLERLELYVSAGLSIDRTLAVSEEASPPGYRAALKKIRTAVESGSTLSDSLARNAGVSGTTADLISHGELSGELGRSLGIARSLLERQDELVKKCLSSLTYPFVIGIFALVLVIGLMRGVMPQIVPMLESLHVDLPLITRILISVSNGLLGYGLYGGLAVIACLAGFWAAYKKILRFRSFCHSLCLNMPVIGSLLRAYATSVFLRSCGSLIASGISIHEAYSSVAGTVALIPLRMRLMSRELEVRRGVALSKVLSGEKTPPFIPALLAAGEASGTLGASAVRAADILDRDIEHSLKRLTSLIEPVMMVGMGLTVGSIALGIMMPIYDISRTLSH